MVTDTVRPDKLSFREALAVRAGATGAWLCLGLDPDPAKLPAGLPPDPDGIVRFCREIVRATADVVAAYKINFAFFEALGPVGWEALAYVRGLIPSDIPVVADAKRGDIGNTARMYADAILGRLDFGAVTVSPYLGWDSLAPFCSWGGKTIFVLCKTSNPGAADLQDLPLRGDAPLYLHVARGALALRCAADIGLVVGATQADALRDVRALDSRALLLIPGVGAQGGSLIDAMRLGADAEGQNALVTVSREILYASHGSDYAAAARQRAMALVAAIREAT